MKPKLYILLTIVLLIAETLVVFQLLKGGEDKFQLAISLHVTISVLFGILTGIHRKSIFVGLITTIVIAMTPLIGVLTMTLLDDKFNRAHREKSSELTGNFKVGNPFISTGGNVELPEIATIVSDEDPAMKRVLELEHQLSESEVNSLSYTRKFSLLPLLEKIAATTSGDGRVLAQAAINEIQDRTAIWSANLHRLQLHKKPIPLALEKLAVTTYIEIEKQGRSPQSFGLPEEDELINMLESRLKREPNAGTVNDLFELLLLSDKHEQAAELLSTHKELPGINFTYLAAKFRATRGEWTELVKLVPRFDDLPIADTTQGARRFWAVDRPEATPSPKAT